MKRKMIIIIIVVLILAIGGAVVVWAPKKGKEKVTDSSAPVFLPQFKDDQDRDGIPDEKEKDLGTSNRDFDTDGDGLSDKSEIEKWKTDPLKPDTDGDGYWDGLEIIRGYNPLGQGKLVQ